MQTKFVNYGVFLLLLTAQPASAQQPAQRHHVAGSNYTISNDEPGKSKETVNTVIDNTSYRLIIINDKLTELYVDGKLVPPDQYSRYEETIKKIKEQLRLDRIQAKKDQEQAMKDQAQAKIQQEKAVKDQQQAKIDQEAAMKDQAAAKIQQEKAEKDQQQAKIDQEAATKDQAAAKIQQEKAAEDQQQAKIDQENAVKEQAQAKIQQEKAAKDQQQAKIDQENAVKEQAQAKIQQEKAAKDQEQAMKDQAAAKIDEERAKEDQRLMKQLISDLVKDGIVSDEKSLQSVKISSTELLVNDKKQPDEVHLKYKTKYPRFATGNFSYEVSNDGNKTIHMHR